MARVLHSNAPIGEAYRTGRVLARFSCGAASAVATKLAIEKYGDAVSIYYNDTGSEHSDNHRFLQDCEAWFGKPVNVLRHPTYTDIWELFRKVRFLSSPRGAPCTSEMKRTPGEAVWKLGDVEVFGYTSDEAQRLERFRRDNNERIIECPLIDYGITKEMCLDRLVQAGIEIPMMYRLGFRNNNCIGCVKARDNLDYWKRVRKHFPDIFAEAASIERELKTTINRITRKGVRTPIYLDEIPEGDPKGPDPRISCGLFCMVEGADDNG